MDYGALPPEINSGRMYAGPGAGSMLAAAAGWDGLSAELQSAASSYESVISAVTSGPWMGPSSTAMAAAAAPYVAWMSATAGRAELAATQAKAAASAYAAAFAATVSPPEIAANRAELALLTATNLFGQNSAAIAATEAQYAEMWAQDAAAMYGYAATSAAATGAVTPFNAAPQTTNLSGLAAQGAASAQSTGSSIGTGGQSALSQLMSKLTGALNSLASPLSSALGGVSSSAATNVTTPFGFLSSNGISVSGIATSLISEYAFLPGFFALSMAGSGLGPLMNPAEFLPFMQMNAAAAAAAAGAGADAPAALGAVGSGFGGLPGLGSLAGIGQAASVGGLSVPAGWGWAATAPPGMLGQVPMVSPAALPLAGDGVAAGLGFPLPLGGLGRTAAAGAAGVVAGAAGAKYLPRLSVVARSPGAGYSPQPTVAVAKYPVPATFPTNGHAPPGYQPAIVYLPTNGHESADV